MEPLFTPYATGWLLPEASVACLPRAVTSAPVRSPMLRRRLPRRYPRSRIGASVRVLPRRWLVFDRFPSQTLVHLAVGGVATVQDAPVSVRLPSAGPSLTPLLYPTGAAVSSYKENSFPHLAPSNCMSRGCAWNCKIEDGVDGADETTPCVEIEKL